MKKIFLFIFFVIGSSWFIPVSCTTGVFSGMRILADMKARDMRQGEALYSNFYVLAKLPNNNEIYQVIYSELDKFRAKNPKATFMLNSKMGEIENELGSWKFSVEESTANTQDIKVYFKGDNVSSESVYKASGFSVEPLFSKVMTPGHMFSAIPYAIALSVLLFFLGRTLYSWLLKRTKPGH